MKIRSCIKRMSSCIITKVTELGLLILARKVVLSVLHMTLYSHSGHKYPWLNFFWFLLQLSNCLSCMFFLFVTKSASFYLHHEERIKASSGCVFCASASYSSPMVSQPSKIIMTFKIPSLCWKL